MLDDNTKEWWTDHLTCSCQFCHYMNGYNTTDGAETFTLYNFQTEQLLKLKVWNEEEREWFSEAMKTRFIQIWDLNKYFQLEKKVKEQMQEKVGPAILKALEKIVF